MKMECNSETSGPIGDLFQFIWKSPSSHSSRQHLDPWQLPVWEHSIQCWYWVYVTGSHSVIVTHWNSNSARGLGPRAIVQRPGPGKAPSVRSPDTSFFCPVTPGLHKILKLCPISDLAYFFSRVYSDCRISPKIAQSKREILRDAEKPERGITVLKSSQFLRTWYLVLY